MHSLPQCASGPFTQVWADSFTNPRVESQYILVLMHLTLDDTPRALAVDLLA